MPASLFLFVFFFVGFLLPGPWEQPAKAQSSDDCYGTCPGPEQLVSKAADLGLARDRYWLILLHARKNFSGWESLVDDPAFFLAETGKYDPAAELEADIRAFFGPDRKAAQKYACRFYARFRWLCSRLEIDPSCFSCLDCSRMDNLDPRSAALVFPTYYLNNPASMFGHTLLIVNTGYENRRLWSAVNYAARTGRRSGAAFAVSGLFGFFKGYYSVMPYYKKIQEYADINQRDIWEYTLNLTPGELRRMLWHVRELNGIYSDYYFFDENCSYNLLFLLEAARPSARLHDRFNAWVLPVDTIRAVEKEKMVSSVVFRPSAATRIRRMCDSMEKHEVDAALEIATGTLSCENLLFDPAMDRGSAARILDLAAQGVSYFYVSGRIDKKTYQKRYLSVLRARSGLGMTGGGENDVRVAPGPRPDSGHSSMRFEVLSGARTREGVFVSAGIRPVFCDLLDSDFIDDAGAQIVFARLLARYYPARRKLALNRFDLVDIISLGPRRPFFSPLSWRFYTGLKRMPMGSGKERLYGSISAGFGPCWPVPGGLLFYTLADAGIEMTGAMENNHALGAGVEAGFLLNRNKIWKGRIYCRAARFFSGDRHGEIESGVEADFRISVEHHLYARAGFTRARNTAESGIELGWRIYFQPGG